MRRTPTLLDEDRRGSSERHAPGKALSRRRFLMLTAVGLIATTCQSAPQSRPSGPVTKASPTTLPAGRLQAVTLDNARRLTSLATLKIKGQALAVGWAKGGTILGVGNSASEIEVWDTSTLKQVAVLKGHTDQVNRVRWSPDGSLVASASSDGTVRIWENWQRTTLLTFQGPPSNLDNPALCVAWAPDGRRVVAGYGNGAVSIWDLGTQQGRLLEGQQANDIRTKAVWGVAWSPDGRLLASSSDKGTVQVWEPRTFKNIQTLQGRGYVGWVYPIAWAPDGRLLVGGSEQGIVEVWEVSSGQELTALQGHAFKVWDTAWAQDGKLIASAGKDGTVHLWGVRG
jgi:WD40 repeat protein